MKETTFIRQNKAKWAEMETKAANVQDLEVETLVLAYRDVLSDLSLAQTQFPGSDLVPYLSGLARKLHDRLYCPQKTTLLQQFLTIMLKDVPAVVIESRYELMAAAALFLFFVIGGMLMVLIDPEDVRNVLGNHYVEMTLDNIRNGVPTNVYNMDDSTDDFVMIFWNNIWIDLKAFAAGALPFVTTVYILQANGVMVGEFQTFFFQHGVGLQSAAAIWIHGTLEMTAMVVAAAAAFRLSRAIYLRGTYSLVDSLQKHGLQSVKLLLSSLPLTLTAAVLESFVTRHTEWPLIIRLSFIILSLVFAVWYYILLPIAVWKSRKQK